MTTYVVGDIQACYSALRKLLDQVQFDPNQDKLWAVGDLIGRGPEALQTLDYLYQLGDSFNTVLGNHDLHFLAVSQGIKAVKKNDGFAELLEAPQCQQLIHWLRQRPLARMLDDNTFLSHAGLYPQWTTSQACALAEEASQYLQSEQWCDLLRGMYGSHSETWSESLEGISRYKFIIDALTRMRYLDQKQQLDFACKLPPAEAPANLYPWFKDPQFQSPHISELSQKIIFGHWASLEGETGNKNIHAIDTGYIWGGKLTLIELKSTKKHQTQQ